MSIPAGGRPPLERRRERSYNGSVDSSLPPFGLVRASFARIGRPRNLLCAVSGGADSTGLLLILSALKEECGFGLACVHVNHGLRAASEKEEGFVRALCGRLGVPLSVVRVEVPREGNLEAAARAARYRAFEDVLALRGAQAVALAHHADDQAETLLMHLMRGSGGAGLAGMREYRPPLWRPLLMATRAQIRALLLEAGEPWCEDESNRDTGRLRNALRHGALRQIGELAPSAARSIARAAALQADEEDFWDGYAADWLLRNASVTGPCPFLLAEPCGRLPAAAQRRLLRALCRHCGLAPDQEQTEALRGLLRAPAGESVNLPGGGLALRTGTRLHLPPAEARGGAPEGALMRIADRGSFGDGRREQALDADRLEGAALRFRMPGDRITPLHAKGSQPLRQYLIDRRVDRPFRAFQPLLARGDRVLWVIGVGVAQTAAVTPDTRARALLRYTGRLPDDLEIEAPGAQAGEEPGRAFTGPGGPPR